MSFSQSYAASGDQARAVKAGLKADIVALSLAPDVDELVAAGLVDANWKRQSYRGMVTRSLVVFVVRDGNPKKIFGWNDLIRKGVEVVTPNPFTSGGARWNVMAAYGAQRKLGKTDRQAQDYLLKLFRNVVSQDKSARDSLQTFNAGRGDVLLAYENEALFAQSRGQNLPFRIPRSTILIENPIAVIEDERPQGGGNRVPALPAHAGGAADLRRERLPAGEQGRGRPVHEEVPRAARPVHDRRARARRLDEGAEAVLRPAHRDHGADRAAGRRHDRVTRVSTDRTSPVRPVQLQSERASTALSLGLVTTYLSLIVGAADRRARLRVDERGLGRASGRPSRAPRPSRR